MSLFAGQREVAHCSCCDRGRCCGDSEAPASEAPKCPISGLPCRAVITSANPTTLVDVVDAPSPVACDEILIVASDSQPKNEASWTPHVCCERHPVSALLDLGQLLRV